MRPPKTPAQEFPTPILAYSLPLVICPSYSVFLPIYGSRGFGPSSGSWPGLSMPACLQSPGRGLCCDLSSLTGSGKAHWFQLFQPFSYCDVGRVHLRSLHVRPETRSLVSFKEIKKREKRYFTFYTFTVSSALLFFANPDFQLLSFSLA